MWRSRPGSKSAATASTSTIRGRDFSATVATDREPSSPFVFLLHGLAAAALELVARRVGLMKGRLPEATWNPRDPCVVVLVGR